MAFKNIKKTSGFTIVELLIVIVVIAILATISIVAYNGIQARAKTSAAQSLAAQIQKKVEAFNTIESAYPTYSELTSNTGNNSAKNSAEAKLDDTSKVGDAGAAGATLSLSDEKKVLYRKCTTGAAVYWYSATDKKIGAIGLGGQASIDSSTGTTTACS